MVVKCFTLVSEGNPSDIILNNACNCQVTTARTRSHLVSLVTISLGLVCSRMSADVKRQAVVQRGVCALHSVANTLVAVVHTELKGETNHQHTLGRWWLQHSSSHCYQTEFSYLSDTF